MSSAAQLREALCRLPPPCPLCQSVMILRFAIHGKNRGSQFWGCRRYPHCKGTREVVELGTAKKGSAPWAL